MCSKKWHDVPLFVSVLDASMRCHREPVMRVEASTGAGAESDKLGSFSVLELPASEESAMREKQRENSGTPQDNATVL